MRYTGLSLLWPLPLCSTGSGRSGSAAMAHGPSPSAACGILPDRGMNLCPLHQQADSQPLRHQGSPPPTLFPPSFFTIPPSSAPKEKLLKATREKQQIAYKGTPIRLTADFSVETLQARREWHDIFKVMKRKNLQPRILYLARLSFRFDGEIKSFTDKQKLKSLVPPNQLYKIC